MHFSKPFIASFIALAAAAAATETIQIAKRQLSPDAAAPTPLTNSLSPSSTIPGGATVSGIPDDDEDDEDSMLATPTPLPTPTLPPMSHGANKTKSAANTLAISLGAIGVAGVVTILL